MPTIFKQEKGIQAFKRLQTGGSSSAGKVKVVGGVAGKFKRQ
jgi:hypothetical protein